MSAGEIEVYYLSYIRSCLLMCNDRDRDREEVTRGRVFLNIQGALLLDRLQLTVRHSALGTCICPVMISVTSDHASDISPILSF